MVQDEVFLFSLPSKFRPAQAKNEDDLGQILYLVKVKKSWSSPPSNRVATHGTFNGSNLSSFFQ